MHDERERTPLAGQCRARAIADDHEQPGAGRAAAKLVEGAIGAKHRILHDVLGKRGVAREVAREVISAVEMRQHELPESQRLVAAGNFCFLWRPRVAA